MNNKVSFPEYYSAIGKPITNGEVYSLNDSNVKILKCDENEYIDIKPEYKILGAYYGCPKSYKKGINVTKKVIDFVRKQRFKRVYASAEWFGDPWYGTRKTLQIQIAVPKPKPKPKPKPAVTAQPAVTATYPTNTTPAYPTTTTNTLPTYPTNTTPAYPTTTTNTLPTYPSGGQPTYPTTTTNTLPTYPSGQPTYPTAPTTLPSYPATNTYPVTNTYPATYPTAPTTTTYPTHTTTTFGGYPAQPTAPTTTVIHAPAPQVVQVGGHQQVSWQYEDPSTHRWINYTPQESHQIDAAMSKGMTKVTLNNAYGSFEVSIGCEGEQVNIKTNGKRAMRFLVRPRDSQGVGMWQFEDGRAGSGQWKNYIAVDATKLSAARSQGAHTCRLTNKWGTYAVTMRFVGTQRNTRTGSSRRIRFNDGTSGGGSSFGGGNQVVSGTQVTLSSSGKWQFEDGNAGSGNWRDMLPQDQLTLDRAVSQGQTRTMVTNRFGTWCSSVVFERDVREFRSFHTFMFHLRQKNITRIAYSYRKRVTRKSTLKYKLDYEHQRSNTGTYQVTFKNPPTRAVQKNVRTNGTRNIRYTGQITAAPAVHHSAMGAHIWGTAMAM